MAGRVPEDLVEAFSEDCLKLTTLQLVAKYNRARSTISEWKHDIADRKVIAELRIKQVRDVPVYDNNIDIQGNFIVTGDIEIPYQDTELLNKIILIGRKFGIKKLIIAGDFVAMDALSDHAHEDSEEERYSVADCLDDGADILSDLFMWFDEIYMIKGNHEQRGNRRRELGFFRQMQDRWGDLGNLKISYYKWLIASGYRIEHPGNYSKVPGSIARERAEIEGKSTIEAHCHHFSYSITKNGEFQAADLGHCTRPETRHYKTVNGTSRYPKWVSGFWVINNGYLYGFTKKFTDWDLWEGISIPGVEHQKKGKRGQKNERKN